MGILKRLPIYRLKTLKSKRNNRNGTRPQFWLYCVIGRLLLKMKRENITENQLVLHNEKGVNGIATIVNVRKADRGDENELMYDLQYLISGEENYEGICEHSGMTSSFLDVISKEDALNMILSKEYDLDIKMGKLNKKRIKLINGKAVLNAL